MSNATSLLSSNASTKKKQQKQGFWEKLENIQQSQGGSRLQALGTLLLTSVQEDYAESLGVELGGEFRTAYNYWKSRNENQQYLSNSTTHPTLVLGDRPLSLTLVRAWESLGWWPKTKVMLGLVWSSLQKPKPDEIRAWLELVMREESDVLTESLQELRKHFPSLHTTIIAERDAWLAAKLVQTCRILAQLQQQYTTTSSKAMFASGESKEGQRTSSSRKKRLVAIVGAGHVPGIVQWLTGNHSYAPTNRSPEDILLNLTATQRWNNDALVQTEMIPMWIQDVTQLQRNDAWSWAEPTTIAGPPQ